MKRKKLFIAGGVILILIILTIGYVKTGNGVENDEIFEVVRQDVTEVVSEVGKVVPVKEMNLAFPLTGKIVQILVSEGQTVKSGELLAKLDMSKVQADLTSAQAAVQESQARLDKINAGASKEDVKVSKTAVSNAEKTLEKVKSAQTSDILFAESSVKAAEITLANAQGDLADQAKDNEEDLKQSYEDALDTIKSAITKADTALKRVDYTREKYFENNTTEDIYIKNSEQSLDNKYDDIKPRADALDVFKTAKTEEMLLELSNFLGDLQDLLEYIREQLEVKPNINPTTTETVYIDTERTNIDTAKTAITTAVQAISSAKLTAEAALNTDESAVSAAQAALDKANANLVSVKSTWESKVSDAGGLLDIAEAELALKTSKAREEDISLYEAQVKQAMASLELIQQTLKDSMLIAPVDGFITDIKAEVGEVATVAGPVLSMMGSDQYQIESYISELDIADLKIGDPTEITFDAFGSDQMFKGEIITVNPYETVIDGDIFYKVTVKFKTFDKKIRPGMTADIAVIMDSKKDVLVVPSRYIGEEGKEKYVKVMTGGSGDKIESERVKITTGLEGVDMTEIVSGLTEGQKIVSYY